MILVTLGTQDKQFRRIIEYVLKAIEDGIIKNEKKIYIQSGQTKQEQIDFDKQKYNNVEIFDFKDEDELKIIINSSEYIISHAGVGMILNSIKQGKKTIIVPREQRFDEHVNNHQLQIAEEFERKNYILVARTYEEFKQCLQQMKSFQPKKYESNTHNFCKKLDELVCELLDK